MKLSLLTNASLINLQTTFESRDQAIHALAEQLHSQGKLHDKEAYLNAVFAREAQGPTALGEEHAPAQRNTPRELEPRRQPFTPRVGLRGLREPGRVSRGPKPISMMP